MDGVVLIEVALVGALLVGMVLGGVVLGGVLLVGVALIGKASHFLRCLLYHQRIGSKEVEPTRRLIQ